MSAGYADSGELFKLSVESLKEGDLLTGMSHGNAAIWNALGNTISLGGSKFYGDKLNDYLSSQNYSALNVVADMTNRAAYGTEYTNKDPDDLLTGDKVMKAAFGSKTLSGMKSLKDTVLEATGSVAKPATTELSESVMFRTKSTSDRPDYVIGTSDDGKPVHLSDIIRLGPNNTLHTKDPAAGLTDAERAVYGHIGDSSAAEAYKINILKERYNGLYDGIMSSDPAKQAAFDEISAAARVMDSGHFNSLSQEDRLQAFDMLYRTGGALEAYMGGNVDECLSKDNGHEYITKYADLFSEWSAAYHERLDTPPMSREDIESTLNERLLSANVGRSYADVFADTPDSSEVVDTLEFE